MFSAPQPRLASRAARKSAPAGRGSSDYPWESNSSSSGRHHGVAASSSSSSSGSHGQHPYLATYGAVMSVPAIYENEEEENEPEAGPSSEAKKQAEQPDSSTLYPQYCWEAQPCQLSPEDFAQESRLSYHSKIKADIEITAGQSVTVSFTRGLQIYVLPDPSSLPPPPTNSPIQPSQLSHKQHWVAEILDACSFTMARERGALGLLRVAWLYTPSQILDSKYIPQYIKDTISKQQYKPNERIKTDHIDFISLETYACPALDVICRIELQGMTVENKERGLEIGNRIKVKGKIVVKLPDPDSGSEGSINLKSDGDE